MFSSVIFKIIFILICFLQSEFECPHKECQVLSYLKSFKYWTVFFSWSLNTPTKNVRFCDRCNHFDNELSFSVGILNVPKKDVKFCDLSNLFDTELSFSVGF